MEANMVADYVSRGHLSDYERFGAFARVGLKAAVVTGEAADRSGAGLSAAAWRVDVLHGRSLWCRVSLRAWVGKADRCYCHSGVAATSSRRELSMGERG